MVFVFQTLISDGHISNSGSLQKIKNSYFIYILARIRTHATYTLGAHISFIRKFVEPKHQTTTIRIVL
jgi:hypothetical protein